MSNIANIRNQIKNHFKQKKEDYLKRKAQANRKRWSKYYHIPQWQSLRQQKFTANPICEVCERSGIVTPTEHIHHRTPFSRGITDEAKYRLLLDYNNLISVCEHHHILFHEYMRKFNRDSATIDDIVLYENNLKQFEE